MTGLFGKIPAHGDFITRSLAQGFVNVWDEWLQCIVAGSREQLGEQWLEYYLTCPIWRFAVHSGVVDGQAWAGILVPSVDSVGRYFPLTIAAPLNSHINLYAFMDEAQSWFTALESAALSALHDQCSADDLLALLPEPPVMGQKGSVYTRSNGNLLCLGGSGSTFSAIFPSIFQDQKPASLWAVPANDFNPASAFIAFGLPSPAEYTAMLSADWQENSLF